MPRHYLQSDEGLSNSDRHIKATIHTLPPRERSVSVLQLAQAADGIGERMADLVVVEISCNSTALGALRLCVSYPRNLVKNQSLERLILLQLAL